jgi:leucyl aminopeptidase (aminopeptidase T)
MFDYEQLKELMIISMMKDKTREMVYRFKEENDPTFRYFQEIIEKDNLDDLRYLFKAGKFISENEIKTARFLAGYPEKKLRKLAQSIVKAYLKGFEEDNKTEFLKQKSTVGLHYKIGLEKLYRHMILEFKHYGLNVSVLANRSTPANEQYTFDHKFDNSLYLTDDFLTMYLNSTKNGLEQNKEILSNYSGIMYIEKFGDPLFSPQKKSDVLKLSEDQQKLHQKWNAEYFQLIDKYTPRSETSFCIVSFPTPKIGDNFEKIFEETIKINMADSNKSEKIQQKIIDVLELADSIHVKGKDANQTSITIRMQPIEDPSSQTNFLNSGASVNIPVGEVFTSPQLKGTNGILHVEETYQKSLRYNNLKLNFTDGYVTDYSCTNFPDDAENRKYIEENLLFPHKSLPLGEFAIGTNTLAYVVSRKYGIIDVLPILISEKTGPHFAIGDTCYSQSEDIETFNQFNQKRICAKENEKSRLRKTNMQEAYSFKHEDIVLAFDSIEFISAIIGDSNKVDIIKNGKFVLEGTEELNIPLLELESI